MNLPLNESQMASRGSTELGVTDERLDEVARIAESIRNDVLCR